MKNILRHAPQLLSMLLTLIFIACTGFVYNSNGAPTKTNSFTVSTPAKLDVSTSGGSITVEGVSGNNVEVLTFIRKNGKLLTEEEANEMNLSEGIELIIEKRGNTIIASAKKTKMNAPWKQISISFQVKIPHDVSCELNTSGGSIELANVNGFQEMNTSGGSIKLSNIEGETNAHTSGGSIKAIQVIGKMELNTSGGSITIADVTGDALARTSGGSIKVENFNGNLDAKTSGGSININGNTPSLSAVTSGGGINVNVTGLKDKLHLDTSGGGIKASIPGDMGMDLNLSANRVNIPLNNFSGSTKNNRIEGSMNGGGVEVYMHTSGGNIDVDYN